VTGDATGASGATGDFVATRVRLTEPSAAMMARYFVPPIVTS